MESDLQQHPTMFLDHQNHHHQQQMNSGLTRFKSAPSSYFSNIIDKEFYEHLFNRPSSPETERVFARFMNSLSGSGGSGGGGGGDAESVSVTASIAPITDSVVDSLTQQLPIVKEEIDQQSQTMQTMNNNNSNNNEAVDLPQLQRQQSNNMSNYGSSAAPQSFYHNSGRPPLPNQMKTGRSNLIRHGSSPAGLFSNINIDTGMCSYSFSYHEKDKTSLYFVCFSSSLLISIFIASFFVFPFFFVLHGSLSSFTLLLIETFCY